MGHAPFADRAPSLASQCAQRPARASLRRMARKCAVMLCKLAKERVTGSGTGRADAGSRSQPAARRPWGPRRCGCCHSPGGGQTRRCPASWIHEPRAALPPARARPAARGGCAAIQPGGGPAAPRGGPGRARGPGHQELRRAATARWPRWPSETGLALLAADEDLAWHHLDALISAALAAVARPAAGGGATPVGDLFALANAIAAMVGGATAIEDPYLHVLAYSTLPGQPIDEHRRAGHPRPAGAPTSRSTRPSTASWAGPPRVCRFTAGPGSLPRLAIAVRAGHRAARLDLGGRMPAAPLGPGAEQALTEAASIAALHLLAARTAADLRPAAAWRSAPPGAGRPGQRRRWSRRSSA